MSQDIQHQNLKFTPTQVEHRYGENVVILSSPLMLSLLAKLGHPSTHQPQINELTQMLYSYLVDQTIDLYFPKKIATLETRMRDAHLEAEYEGEIVDPEIPVVSVDLARAGTFPSHLCYNKLNYLMNPIKVRQDHFYVARVSDESGQVTGVSVAVLKLVETLSRQLFYFLIQWGHWLNYCKSIPSLPKTSGGKPRMMVAMHLIITPEYIQKVTKECPDLKIVALRLDRGLSGEEVLKTIPGTHVSEEKGLNQHQYIIPGAGGLGEILNNSYC